MADNSHTNQLKGKASFQLFLLDTFGRYSPLKECDETLNRLTVSAHHGYDGAFLIGNRVFAANNQPIPKLIQDGPKGGSLRRILQLLESLPSNEFYANAVRIFWAADLRSRASDCLRIPRSSRFKECVRDQMAKFRGMARQEFREYVKNIFWFHQAVIHNDKQVIIDLAEAGCDIDTKTLDGLTSLHLACRTANTPLIRLLLSYGADASLNDAVNISLIHWVILLPNHEIPQIADLLVHNGAHIGASLSERKAVYFEILGLKMYGTPLSWACASRNAAAVKTLLNLGEQVGGYNLSKHELTKIDQGIRIVTSLLCSDILDILLNESYSLQDLGPEEHEYIWSHVGVGEGNDLQQGCLHGELLDEAYADTTNALIRAGIPFLTHPRATTCIAPVSSPLYRAAISFNATLINKYIDIGADVNERDWRNGETALHGAIQAWSASIATPAKMLKAIAVLIDRGASLEDEQDPPNHRMSVCSPLHLACTLSAPPCVIRLLANCAKSMVNKKHWGVTPLHRLSSIDSTNNKDTLEHFHILLDNGADLNIESDHDGGDIKCCVTPVAEILRKGDWRIAEMLLNEDCNTNFGVSGGHKNTLSHLIIFEGFEFAIGRRNGNIEPLFEEFFNHPNVRRRNLLNDVNYRGISPIAMAVAFGVPQCAKILVEHGCDMTLPSGKNVSSFLDNQLEHPPQFVVDERIVTERTNETARKLLMSYSQYRDNLTAIRQMLNPKQQIPHAFAPFTDPRVIEEME